MKIDQLTVGTMGVCCYILGCEATGKAAIIDPGGDEAQILAKVKELNLTVTHIINTHGHPDHVCGNRPIKKATGAAIVMHEADADFFNQQDVINYFSMLGLPQSPPVDIKVKDNDTITVGEIKLKVIHTPGHTPGGICLYNAPHLFTGDTLFVGGVGRTDFPGGNTRQLIDAIREKLLVLPENTMVWPGHGYGGDSSTIKAEKHDNPYLHGVF